MQHSIAAKYAARPTAHFVRPSARVRERQLGLRPVEAFQAAPVSAAWSGRADVGPVTRLRARWRSIRPAAARAPRTGTVRRPVAIRWAGSGSGVRTRRAAAPTASWRS